MQSAHVHKPTQLLLFPFFFLERYMALHIQPPQTNCNSQNGHKVNPVDKEILQLFIKEDTRASNYSNGASCHNSNMTVRTPYSINQETATCLSQQELQCDENNLPQQN